MAKNTRAIKRGFHYDYRARSLGIYVDGIQVADYSQIVGRTYYVNSVLGSSSNDGLSWGTAFDQINTAITASEVYRQLGGVAGGASGTTNDYVRNTIIVQAAGELGGSEYESITALPLHCDIIGLGDWPAGMGQGMVIIGRQNANLDAITSGTDTVRGLGLYNLHAAADNDVADTYDALSVANFFRSRIEDCWFGQATGSENINAGIECDSSFSGVLIRHCMIGQTNSNGRPKYGMDFESCTPGSNNLFEDNIIFGETTGILQTSTDNWNGAVIRNNVIGAITGECSATGITAALYELITGNHIRAATALTVPSAGQTIGNFINEGGTGGVETIWATLET